MHASIAALQKSAAEDDAALQKALQAEQLQQDLEAVVRQLFAGLRQQQDQQQQVHLNADQQHLQLQVRTHCCYCQQQDLKYLL